MKTEKTEPKTREDTEKDAERRPYEKPGFLSSMAFERSSLACAGNKNTAPFLGCAMQS
jgi:hypothetical protein